MARLFKVAKHHGCAGAHTLSMGLTHNLKPWTGEALIGGDLFPDLITEDFGPSARNGIKTRIP